MGSCLTNFLKCLQGNCCSCFESVASQGGVVNERTHLLVDPINNYVTVQAVHSEELLAPNCSANKPDEQSALNKILQEAATNVIDVAALGSHNMEQHEYFERMNQYHSKIAIANGSWQNSRKPSCLLIDIPDPEKVLSGPAISLVDYILVMNASKKIKAAMEHFEVQHREELVVPFEIP